MLAEQTSTPPPLWPPDFTSEWRYRVDRLQMLAHDDKLRAAINLHYKNNCIDWIAHNCITYDPRKSGSKDKSIAAVMPFMMFPKQKDFITFLMSCLDEQEGGLVEKSRDMGATWLCCAVSIWLWLYHPGSSVGWGSRKEELVDKLGDPDSIFQKMRMIIRYLPRWMLPEGFDWRLHSSYMKLINPQNGSTITGESGDNIGRGGRKSIYFKDESAHYEHPELIEAALSENTNVQIDISSVCGIGNIFYRRRMAGEIWEKGGTYARGMTRVFIMDWRDHPAKDQEWYEAKRAKNVREGTMHLFAQEVDRSYSASVMNVIIPSEWVKASIDAHIVLGLSDAGEKTAGFDVADGGIDKNALACRSGVVLRHIEDWAKADDVGDSTRMAVTAAREHGVHEFYYDCIGVGAGVKAEANRMRDAGSLGSLRILPWDASGAVANPEERIIPGDMDSLKNVDFFYNLKAQAWWNLRTRFYKTWRAVIQKAVYPPDELISLSSEMPKLHKLVEELSQAVYKHNSQGLMLVDKKPDGTMSPNLADACVICYNPNRTISILDAISDS